MNYKEIIQSVLQNGVPKQPTRMENGKPVNVENSTIGTFSEIFRHDMSQGFPLSTLRRAPWKSICIELEGFIKGITSKKWYQDRGCKFWDEWSNPKSVNKTLADSSVEDKDRDSLQAKIDLRKKIQSGENDLGPIYGYQWRSFGEQFGKLEFEDYIEGGCCPATGEYQQILLNVNGLDNGFDQLKTIVDTLKTNPYDRRMVCSAWNPNQMDQMALPPCHWGFNVVVYGDKLNLVWHQRSCDLMLGVPANIASYALLLLLLCEESGLKPGELVGTLADTHIYSNLMETTVELVKRDEKPLPTVKIKRKLDGSFSIFDWTHEDVELINYNPHPKMDMGKVTV